MLTDSQTKFIDAIIYDQKRSPLYYAKLTEAEKYRLTHDTRNGCEVVNIQLLGWPSYRAQRENSPNTDKPTRDTPSPTTVQNEDIIKKIHKNKVESTQTFPKKYNTREVKTQQYLKRRNSPLHPKCNPHTSSQRAPIPPKLKETYLSTFLESDTFVCVCDECSDTNLSSRTYIKRPRDTLGRKDAHDKMVNDDDYACEQPAYEEDGCQRAVSCPPQGIPICQVPSAALSPCQTSGHVHIFQKFTPCPQECPSVEDYKTTFSAMTGPPGTESSSVKPTKKRPTSPNKKSSSSPAIAESSKKETEPGKEGKPTTRQGAKKEEPEGKKGGGMKGFFRKLNCKRRRE